MLDNAKRLKNLLDGHRYKRVFIRQDMTQLQRENDYKKRQEMKQQQEGRRDPKNVVAQTQHVAGMNNRQRTGNMSNRQQQPADDFVPLRTLQNELPCPCWLFPLWRNWT